MGFHKSFLKCMHYSVFTVSISLFILSHIIANLNFMLLSLFLFWIGNILYGCMKAGERILFFVFNFAIAFFLFARNVVEMFSGINWHEQFSYKTNSTVVSLIFISLVFLLVGAIVADKCFIEKNSLTEHHRQEQKEFFIKNLQLVSLILFLFCAAFLFMTEIDKLLFMNGKEYYQYYAEYKPRIPGVFVSIGALAKFAFCVYLATLPTKKQSFVPMGLYLLSAVPMFIIGQRNQLISVGLMFLCYYIIRDYCNKKTDKKWFGKIEKTLLIIVLPFGLAFLSLYESIRKSLPIQSANVFQSIANLIKSQGVTYDVVAKGIDHINHLPITNISYTFGPLINYFKGNFISSILFGTSSIPNQTIESAIRGNNFDNTISFLTLGNNYVTGAGLGSSYIIETYIDFGIVGIALFSLLLGLFLVFAVKAFKKNILSSFFILLLMLSLFMLPRSTALGWFVPALYIPMYPFLIIMAILAGLLIKKYSQYSDKKICRSDLKCFKNLG